MSRWIDGVGCVSLLFHGFESGVRVVGSTRELYSFWIKSRSRWSAQLGVDGWTGGYYTPTVCTEACAVWVVSTVDGLEPGTESWFLVRAQHPSCWAKGNKKESR